MQKHPFNEHVPDRLAGIGLVTAVWAVYVSFLALYGGEEWRMAAIDGLLAVGILAVAGYQLWYVTGVLRAPQAGIILALAVQAVCIGSSYIFQEIVSENAAFSFLATVPLRLLIGLAGWIILYQWYRFVRLKEEAAGEQLAQKEEEAAETSPAPSAEAWIDRISVKDGARIHLIRPEELLYIQAGGDYVMLVTPGGQYMKEQTMKYFEQHLSPALFVRIHRLCIINVEQIARVELFGKENYQVRLKCGVSLRASLNGYKLLKKRLSL